jgi:CBS domain-containing protein
MNVKEILKSKSPKVFTIGEDKPLYDGLKILVDNNIGVLLVMNNEGNIAGIISERDIIREAYNNPDGLKQKMIGDLMTKNIIFAELTDDIEYVESIMTSNHIRHVPVLENKALVGLISIGDIVKTILSKTQFENKYLNDYISGKY